MDENERLWATINALREQQDKLDRRIGFLSSRVAVLERELGVDKRRPRKPRVPGGATDPTTPANHGRKTYTGLVAPDGTIYAPIVGLNAFCKEHGLSPPAISQVISGKRATYRGWRRYEPHG